MNGLAVNVGDGNLAKTERSNVNRLVVNRGGGQIDYE